MTGVVAESHTTRPRGTALIALCAGFVVIAVALTITGVVPSP
jgi:amino acid transporter